MGTDKNIKLHIVTDIKEIISNTLTSLRNYHVMLRIFIILVVWIAIESGYSRCNFFGGDGIGDDELRLKGIRTSADCANACMDLKKYNNKINGATWQYKHGTGCWCEMGMTKRERSWKYISCFITS